MTGPDHPANPRRRHRGPHLARAGRLAAAGRPAGQPDRVRRGAAYAEQVAFVQECGATAVVMASRPLAALATGPDDYRRAYDQVLSGTTAPVVLHWLGDMFDPALARSWGSTDLDDATKTFVSLLEAEREIRLRDLLPPTVRVYTGDDYHYPELIAGDGGQFSHALLGAFAAIAPAASAALQRLDAGDTAGFREVLDPTVPLSRHVFAPPTVGRRSERMSTADPRLDRLSLNTSTHRPSGPLRRGGAAAHPRRRPCCALIRPPAYR
ncbi:DUF993 family protein [Dactylosporangium sp. CA-233914]|uniref:DUF993 family protein n=1 Tax=Dactylosporangium sp. CA-233914 TaxID=3239934 RepID=UPI003D8A7498